MILKTNLMCFDQLPSVNAKGQSLGPDQGHAEVAFLEARHSGEYRTSWLGGVDWNCWIMSPRETMLQEQKSLEASFLKH